MTLRTATGPAGHPVVVPAGVEVLRPFIEAGVFGSYEAQFAAGVLRLQAGLDDEELLALAVAARAPRFGHVCTPLDAMEVRLTELDGEVTADLPWPSADAWAASLSRSSIVSLGPTDGPLRPLVWDGDRLYLHRYWHYELAIADGILRRCAPITSDSSAWWSGSDDGQVDRVLDSLFGADGTAGPDLQRLAARRALGPGVSIIAGGPGTGKTYTVARLLAAAHVVAAQQGRPLSVALAAPTGKAAARMGEAVQAALADIDASEGLEGVGGMVAATAPTTIHSLLGWADRTHFRHDRQRPLPEDMVIVDETSMVSLPLMAKLLDAVRPGASVVLVGDPYQLASIEAGTVMSDLVGPAGRPETPEHRPVAMPSAPAASVVVAVPTLWDSLETPVPEPVGADVLTDRVTVLRTMRRFGADSTIAALADAIRTGDGTRALALLERGASDVRWVRPDDPEQLEVVTSELVEVGEQLVLAAARGDGAGALEAGGRVKVLAATRRGPNGVAEWTDRIEQGIASLVADFQPNRRWYVGRPVLVTANDRANRVFNGDAGVVVKGEEGMEVALASGDGLRLLAPSRLDRVETWWAMTIHKSQGSEFPHAVVALPDYQSPILTRELLYTAVTRARERLTVVAGSEAVERAVTRPLARASGLRGRLWSD